MDGWFFFIYNSTHCGFPFFIGLGDIIYIIYRGLKLLFDFSCFFYYLLGLVMIFFSGRSILYYFFMQAPSQEKGIRHVGSYNGMMKLKNLRGVDHDY